MVRHARLVRRVLGHRLAQWIEAWRTERVVLIATQSPLPVEPDRIAKLAPGQSMKIELAI